jgi:hypothetical protein
VTPAAEVAHKGWLCARPHRAERVGGGAPCNHHLCVSYRRARSDINAVSDINGLSAVMRGSWSQP